MFFTGSSSFTYQLLYLLTISKNVALFLILNCIFIKAQWEDCKDLGKKNLEELDGERRKIGCNYLAIRYGMRISDKEIVMHLFSYKYSDI